MKHLLLAAALLLTVPTLAQTVPPVGQGLQRLIGEGCYIAGSLKI